MVIEPWLTSYMRMSRRSSVDLPLPEGPTMAQELPEGMSRLTPLKMPLSSAPATRFTAAFSKMS